MTKSLFMRGIQCRKSLWLHQRRPELGAAASPVLQARLDEGASVRALAGGLFVGDETLFDTVFLFDSFEVSVDILRRTSEGWYLYVVKSHTTVYSGTIRDAALQYYGALGRGVLVERVFVLHVNADYVMGDVLDLDGLFVCVEVTDEVRSRQDGIRESLGQMRRVLAMPEAPRVAIGGHCSRPFECEFKAHCWGASGSKVSEDALNVVAVNSFLARVTYPVCFVDFEVFQSAVPLFSGTKPFEFIPFQYSVHFQESPGGVVSHRSFLAPVGEDPRRAFVEGFLRDVPDDASLVVYDRHLELQIMRALARQFPEFSEALSVRMEHVVDLFDVFKDGHVSVAAMQGRYSIKAVLPALIPELRYDALVIGQGEMASRSYLQLWGEADAQKQSEVVRALEAYSWLDTYAMLCLLDRIRVLVLEWGEN